MLSRAIAQALVSQIITVDQLVAFLTRYKLMALMPMIQKELTRLHAHEHAQGRIEVESPFPLSAESLAKVKRLVGNDLAEVAQTENKELLAGFRATYRGVRYDASARHIINSFLQG